MAVQNQRSGNTTNTNNTTKPTTSTTTATTTIKSKALTTPTTMPQTNSNSTTATTTANGGPRVSFNRDVHVKRIGKHPDDITNYETTNLQPPQNSNNTGPPYHQLPAELSAEDIRKEAALVLAQAERHKSKAENADNIPTFRVKVKRTHSDSKKFHSLPTRKKQRSTSGKPVARSVSDAAAKKPSSKRPSIFNIFSRKSDTNINQIERDPRFEDSGGRRLVRSKSDVGSSSERKQKKITKETKSVVTPAATAVNPLNGNSGLAKQLHHSHTPLSPIIENAQKEDYFAEQFNRERRKSDAITDREKHDSGLEELLARSRLQAEVDGPLLARPTNNNVSRGIQDKIRTLQAKSNENMHSSQLPATKLPLTKGVTVDGMVKRLSMERFSPPPTINSPAFSYIRPNDGITYAQLDMNDDSQQQQPLHSRTLPRTERIRSPYRETRTPVREFKSPLREYDFGRSTLQRNSEDRHENFTSQNYLKNNYNERPNRNSFSPSAVGPTTIRISSSHSPSPWQQLSPRNLSDEDEGLGYETRKYFEEDSHKIRSKSPTEPPIVPVIRSITPPPRENGFHHATRAYLSPPREDPVDSGLGYRRAQLESRILTRRFGDATTATLGRNGHMHASSSPERNRDVNIKSTNSHLRYLSPEREGTPFEQRFHKPQSTEILQKYSPERSHLDIIAPTTVNNTMPKMEKTSRYRHTKYYNDGHGDGKVKEVYERETQVDAQGKSHVRESRYREPLDSSIERQHLTDYEPKSLDSQFTSTDQYRSSPENMKHQQQQKDELWHTSSLKRNKLQQRSFDKGDSGIENDFRKESFNGGDLSNRWRKRTPLEEMKACELFLKKERRHTEQQYTTARPKDDYIYRERSIDDGSHFDPHLDKYPISTSRLTLHRRDQQSQTGQGQEDTLKRNKKLGGFEKVKQLFTGGSSSGGVHGSGSSSGHSAKKDQIRANSTTSSSTQMAAKGTEKDKNTKYMVREEEMRSRYREHRGASLQHELKPTDISTRRRLSTPKASPLLLKRTSSDKTAKKESPLAKPEKTSWFKSLDRRSKSKSKEKLNVPETTSTLKRSKVLTTRNSSLPPVPPQTKNLRFFGDTDLDSNPPTISRAHTTLKSRPAVSSTLNRSQKYSQSVNHLDRMNDNVGQHSEDYRRSLSSSQQQQQHNGNSSRLKSSSLHNLESGNGNDEVDFRKRRHFSRSRDLHDISESGSETEEQHKRSNGFINGKTLSRERLDRTQRYDENSYRRSNERQSTPIMAGERNTNSMQRRAHLNGPPKPARSAERRTLSSYSRERERFPGESSGTEGESSLHSQRSIVYLHATTVGAIPQPYHLRRRTMSREELQSNKSKNSSAPPPLQPMTRTVSRSVSLLAPWKPKHISDGYEINYSQEQNKRMSTLPHKSSQMNGGSSSTLTRPGNKKSETLRRIKDDQSSLRNSSTTSKSLLSSNLRSSSDTKRRVK